MSLRASALTLADVLALVALARAYVVVSHGSPPCLDTAGVTDVTIWHSGIDTAVAWLFVAVALSSWVIAWRKLPRQVFALLWLAILGLVTYIADSDFRYGSWSVQPNYRVHSAALIKHSRFGGSNVMLTRVVHEGSCSDTFRIVTRPHKDLSFDFRPYSDGTAYPAVVRSEASRRTSGFQVVAHEGILYVLADNRLLIAASEDFSTILDVNAIDPFALLGPRDEGHPRDVTALFDELLSPIDNREHTQARLNALTQALESPNPWVRATVQQFVERSAPK